MKQSICISCNSIWNGHLSVAKREGIVYVVFSQVKLNNYIYILGLYCSLVFTCQCSNEIKINTSKQCPKTSKRDINIRSAIGKLMFFQFFPLRCSFFYNYLKNITSIKRTAV
jgi:hypothetical protein